jgi:hypothetical protein
MLRKLKFADLDIDGYCLVLDKLTWVNYIVGDEESQKELILENIKQKHGQKAIEAKFSFELHNQPTLKNLQIENPILILTYPENSLFPKSQKKIPDYLTFLSKKYNLQIFVITTSPFVISGMMKLTNARKSYLKIPKKKFRPSQKVYFLKEGKTATKSGRTGVDNSGFCLGSDGYWGYKAGKLAMQILGTGLDDFLSKVEPEYSASSPVLVFCEGAGRSSDAKIYNQIFNGYYPSILFVSSKSNTETLWSYELLAQVKNGLSGDFRVLMLRDRDHDFKTVDSIKRMQKNHPNRRVLLRRAIECYLYNSEVASLWLKSLGLKLPANLKRELDQENKVIQKEVEKGVMGSEYKFRLKKRFKRVYNFAVKNLGKKQGIKLPDFDSLPLILSDLIDSKTKVFKELEEVLFG